MCDHAVGVGVTSPPASASDLPLVDSPPGGAAGAQDLQRGRPGPGAVRQQLRGEYSLRSSSFSPLLRNVISPVFASSSTDLYYLFFFYTSYSASPSLLPIFFLRLVGSYSFVQLSDFSFPRCCITDNVSVARYNPSVVKIHSVEL